ncbi:MAG TPA: hypothetical protein VF032_18345 [Thermoleophilaceae bacterium]
MRVVALISLLCLFLAGCGGAADRPEPKRGPARAPNGPVVLGSKNFIQWGGRGFGTPHPDKLVVGGDPSVLITHIRWHNWGRERAWGVGRYAAPHYGEGGVYYRKTLRADLRLHGIGRCRPNGPRTYMAMKVKVALQPNQRPAWYEVDGSHGLCSYP